MEEKRKTWSKNVNSRIKNVKMKDWYWKIRAYAQNEGSGMSWAEVKTKAQVR